MAVPKVNSHAQIQLVSLFSLRSFTATLPPVDKEWIRLLRLYLTRT